MSQSTGTGTDFFSLLINFGTDVLALVLVLVQFSSTDSVLVLIAQVLNRSVPVPLLNNMQIKSVIALKSTVIDILIQTCDNFQTTFTSCQPLPPPGQTLIISSVKFQIYGSARNEIFEFEFEFFVLILVLCGI